MPELLKDGLRFVMAVSAAGGVLVGLIAGAGASFTGGAEGASAEFAANAFLLLLAALPAAFYVRLLGAPSLRALGYGLAALAWLPALVFTLVFFMMPVVILPIVLGAGVTVENSSDWYRAVYSQLLGWRLALVAAFTLVGFAVAVYSARPGGSPDPS